MPFQGERQITRRIWAARVLIGLVLVSNLSAAIPYLLRPSAYLSSFELQGEPGRVAVFAVGLLFLMWQVPYFFAMAQPQKNRNSLDAALLMHAIGLIGELWLRGSIPADFLTLRGSILRFAIFDGAGLLVLLAAAFILPKQKIITQSLEEKC